MKPTQLTELSKVTDAIRLIERGPGVFSTRIRYTESEPKFYSRLLRIPRCNNCVSPEPNILKQHRIGIRE
jgi:hypothetical protein